MLAMHKDVQEKVFREINATVESNDGMIDIETLHKLTYLEMVIKETMWLPTFGREATDEFEVEGRTVPKGAILISSIFYLHRNVKYWGEDALLFRPERFSSENLKKIHPYAFVPFTG
jgi:cytochrome P450